MTAFKNNRKFTRDDVSEIVRQRVNKLNRLIEELESENAILRKEIEIYERREKAAKNGN